MLPDSLRSCVFPLIAQAIRGSHDEIISRWESAVRESLRSTDHLSVAQLRDDLPNVLSRLAEALETDQSSPFEDFQSISALHGTVRFQQSCDLPQLFLEYDLLRRVMQETVVSCLGRSMSAPEVIALNMALDLASRRSVLAFVGHQHHEMQISTEAQSKYLSFLSHDLRGSLNGVLLMVEVLYRELMHNQRFSQSLEDLDMMRRSILDTVGVMDRFLHAEQFRKGKVQVAPAPLQLSSVIHDAVNQYAYQARDKGLAIEIDAPITGEIVSDKGLINLILLNLLSNAIKFSDKGPIRVALSSDANTYRMSVIDNGPGIRAEVLPDLFRPFVRGDSHGAGGVGLGLSIAKQAAELLDARLFAESSPGQGASFHLEISTDGRALAPSAPKNL